MEPVHVDDLAVEEDGHEEHRVRRVYLGRATGLTQLGASVYEVPPGKRDWPLHFHHANEEGFYFLEGEGVLRTPSGEHPVRPGSFFGAKRQPECAHQVINTGDVPLRFLCFSGMVAPDVTEYPEQGKLGVFCGGAPGTPDEARSINEVHRREGAVGYWD